MLSPEPPFKRTVHHDCVLRLSGAPDFPRPAGDSPQVLNPSGSVSSVLCFKHKLKLLSLLRVSLCEVVPRVERFSFPAPVGTACSARRTYRFRVSSEPSQKPQKKEEKKHRTRMHESNHPPTAECVGGASVSRRFHARGNSVRSVAGCGATGLVDLGLETAGYAPGRE